MIRILVLFLRLPILSRTLCAKQSLKNQGLKPETVLSINKNQMWSVKETLCNYRLTQELQKGCFRVFMFIVFFLSLKDSMVPFALELGTWSPFVWAKEIHSGARNFSQLFSPRLSILLRLSFPHLTVFDPCPWIVLVLFHQKHTFDRPRLLETPLSCLIKIKQKMPTERVTLAAFCICSLVAGVEAAPCLRWVPTSGSRDIF